MTSGIDFGKATAQGPFIRFFEQAFEWEQIQYVLWQERPPHLSAASEQHPAKAE